MQLPFPAPSYDILQLLRVLEQQSQNISIKGSIALSAPIADATHVNTNADGSLAITQSSFTLAGATGSLPEHITERLHQRIAHKDRALLDSLDTLHHPLFLLLYRAWKCAHFALTFEQSPNHPTGTTATLASNTGLNDTFNQLKMGDVHRYFAGLFSHRTRPGNALRQMLSHHFNLPVGIRYFTGKWVNIDPRETTRLGYQPQYQQHNQLGKDCLVGKHTWLAQNHFTLEIGPLDYLQYQRLLPHGDIFIALQELAQIYAGDELAADIVLIIKETAIPRCKISQQNPKQLGWTSWLKTNDEPGGQNRIQFSRQNACNNREPDYELT